MDKKLGGMIVCKRYPSQVSKDKHKAKAIGSNVHGGEDALLHEHGVPYVNGVKDIEENHATRDTSGNLVLFLGTGNVQKDPQYQTRAELAEFFPVKGSPKGARVEFTAHKEVVNMVSRPSRVGKDLLLARHGVFGETHSV